MLEESAENTLAAELEELPKLSRAELHRRWRALYGSECPTQMSRRLLVRALAHRMQEQALGGLDLATRRRLEAGARELQPKRGRQRAPRCVEPGTRLLREWRGTVHEVVVLETGAEYRGKAWSSLSAVAREITGTRWSGPRFFGLTGPQQSRG